MIRVISLAVIALTFNLVSCGQDESKLFQDNIEDYKTKFTCADSSDDFAALVNQKKYDAAIKLTCSRFSLNCDLSKISFKTSGSGYAYTNALSNKVTVLPKAFHYQQCPKPHEGWFAAVLGHEIVHTKQSKWDRWRGAKFDKKLNAKLEIEGWKYMWQMRDRFKLNTAMRIQIGSEIEAYKKEAK
jgi:hypothetical protein